MREQTEVGKGYAEHHLLCVGLLANWDGNLHDWKAFAAMQPTGDLHLTLTAAFHIQNVLILYKEFIFDVTHLDQLPFT